MQPHLATENGIKNLLSMDPPIKKTQFPPQSISPIRKFHKPLILLHQKEGRLWKPQSQKTKQSDHMDHQIWPLLKGQAIWSHSPSEGRQIVKTTITENWAIWSHGPQPCLIQLIYEPCCVGSRWTDHGGEFWQNVVHWRREWQTTSVILRTSSTVWKSKKIGHWKMNSPRSVGAQYVIGDQWRNNSRKNEGVEPKQKQHPVVDVTGDRSQVQCCKEQYFIVTWNIRLMNQGKLEVIKQEMGTVNVDILGIRELNWTGMGEFNSGDHYIYYCGQESLKRNGVALIVNKRVWNAVPGCNLKNYRLIFVRFQGKPFNITVIQGYCPNQ